MLASPLVRRVSRSLPLLTGMYTLQGLVFGFTSGVLLPLLAARGVSLEDQSGLFALASLPWVFKLPIALALDRVRPGAARVAGASMVALGLLLGALSSLGDALPTFGALAVAWLGVNVLVAAQDVCADTLVIDTIEPRRRGLANGVVWGSQNMGATLLGTVVLGALVVEHGPGLALTVLAGASVAGGLWAWRSKLRPGVSAVRGGLGPILRSPSTWAIGGLLSVLLVANVATSALAGEFFVQRLGWPLERVYTRLPWAVLLGQVLGYAAAAAVVDRIGHAKAAALGSVSLGLSWAGFAGLAFAWPVVGFIYGFVIVESVATALLFVGLYAWLMDQVLPRFRATHYAVFMSLINLPRAWVPGFAPGVLEALGWSGTYAAAGALQVVLGGVAWLLARRATGTSSEA